MGRHSSTKCLICYSHVKNLRSQINTTKSPSSSQLNRDLQVIFIFKTIFQLSSRQLTSYLKSCPDINDWITLCENCEQLVTNCKLIYYNFLKLQEKLLAARLNIIKAIKASYNSNERGQLIFSIANDCRRIVHNESFPKISTNPFINGDAAALNKLTTDLSPAFNQNIKVKEEPEDIPTEEHVIYQYFQEEFEVADDDDLNDYKRQPPHSPVPPSPLSLKSRFSNSSKTAPYSRKSQKRLQISSKSSSKRNSKYGCPICHRILPGPSSLHLHKAIRHNLGFMKRFPCAFPNCQKCFASAYKLHLHKITQHNNQNKKVSSNRKFFIRRLNLHPKSSLTFRCPYCHHHFASKNDLSTHKLQIHKLPHRKKPPLYITPNQIYSCTHCPTLKFKILKDLQNHKLFHHSKPTVTTNLHQCQLCPSKFTQSWNLKRHLRLTHDLEPHSEENSFQCPKCPRRFTNHGKMRNHCQLAHQVALEIPEIPKWACEYCGGVYKNKSCYNAHLKLSNFCKTNYRGEKELEVICDQCGGKFANRISLLTHVRTKHERKFNFNCEHCGSGFVQNSLLKRHLFNKHGIGREEEINEKFKKWVCVESECEGKKRFGLKRELECHMDWHKGTPRFTCEECGKQFYFESIMKVHIKNVHVNKNMFKCNVCGNGFKKEEKLIVHLNTWHVKGPKKRNPDRKPRKKINKKEKN